MENQLLINKATAHVIDALQGKTGEPWEGSHPVHEGISGWCGVMAPLNRPAFVGKFGEDFTRSIEQAAKAELARRADFWEHSQGKQHEKEANAFRSVDGYPEWLNAGTFVWGVGDGLKCDHENLRRVMRHLISNDKNAKPQLCKVTRVEEVEDIERDIETVLKGWKAQDHEGGETSDDVTDEEVGKYWEKWNDLTDEQKRTFYSLVVAVIDHRGHYFLIDPQGYDYPRYVLLPTNWKEVYAPTVEQIKAELKAEKDAEEQAKAKEEAAARAAYDARCAKWEKFMTPVTPQQWGIDTATGKKNVLAMAKAAFPWVRFSVRYSSRWGHGYILKWTNGPTAKELQAATDFGLFKPSEDTFDSMTDSSGVEYARFTDFADKFGGVCNGVEFDRLTAAHDRNRDPNAPEPAAPAAPTGDKLAEVRENPAKNGVEIRFPSMPSEEIRAEIRSHGFRWSKFAKVWYNQATDENRAVAAEAVAKFNAGKEAA